MYAQRAGEVLRAAGQPGELAAGGARYGAGGEESHVGNRETMLLRYGRPDGLDRRRRIGAGGARGAFGDDHQTVRRRAERGHVSTPHRRRGVRDGGLDVLRVVVAPVDGHQIGDPAGDVQLSVQIDAQVAGAQPIALYSSAFRMAALLERGLQPGAERVPGFVGQSPVASANVVALQPDFADFTVGELRAGFGVDDHRPQAAGRPADRHLRDGIRGVGRDAHRVTGAQLFAVEIDYLRLGAGADGRDEQRRL